jgi:hypothetical protein
MTTEATITGMRRIAEPKPNKAGYTILAFFECATGEFNLRGCAFVRTPRGGLTAWPPKIPGEDLRRTVTFRSESLGKSMVYAAQAAYRSLGGADGEFPGHDEEERRLAGERRAVNFAAAARRVAERQEVIEAEATL